MIQHSAWELIWSFFNHRCISWWWLQREAITLFITKLYSSGKWGLWENKQHGNSQFFNAAQECQLPQEPYLRAGAGRSSGGGRTWGSDPSPRGKTQTSSLTRSSQDQIPVKAPAGQVLRWCYRQRTLRWCGGATATHEWTHSQKGLQFWWTRPTTSSASS